MRARRPVEVLDADVRATTMHGDGPGGQAVNKASNAVRLLHLPTGLVARSHKTRSLEHNRRDAMRLLWAALDERVNGTASLGAIEALRERARKHSAARKSRRKHEAEDT